MYTREYFIKKFEAIPEYEIGSGSLGKHCALWYCGQTYALSDITEETKALASFLRPYFKSKLDYESDYSDEDIVWRVNDRPIFGPNPKQRILNGLKYEG